MDDHANSTPPSELHQDPGLGPGLLAAPADPRAPAATADDAAIVSPVERSTAFVAVAEGHDVSPSAEVLLVLAYVAMWLLVLGFVWLSFRRLVRLDARLSDLEDALARREALRAEREP
ncbi:MAG TPA: CcmD family protein [Polyangiaceae bacterium]|nr:CcmD family protein [Polyangiaceae bacterium]